MKFYYMIMLLIMSNFTFSLGIEIYYPNFDQELCSSTPVKIKWNGIATDFNVLVKTENNPEFQKIQNYEVQSNTLIWKVNSDEFFNVPLTFRISSVDYPDDFDEVEGITVYRDIEVIDQTKSFQICEGEDIFLDINAIGYELSYQWFKDGNAIQTATSSTLFVPKADYSHSGVYTCSIESNSLCGQKEISPISVYVASKTKFLSNPKNVFWEYLDNGKMIAEIHANIFDETNNVSFQWFKDSTIFVAPEGGGLAYPVEIRIKLQDGKKYTGTKSHDFVVKNMVWGDRAEYYCIAEGLCGKDTATGSIGAQKFYKIINKSPDYFGCEGKTIKFKASIETNETGTFTYQWYRSGNIKLVEGEKFSGTETLELTIHNADRFDNSTYYVLVTLVEKKVYDRSEAFTYMPEFKPAISDQPRDWVIHAPRDFEPDRIYLKIFVYNFEPCIYEWFKGASLIQRSQDNSYRKSSVDSSDIGWYKCRIRNNCGSIWSDSIYVAWGFQNNKFSACMNEKLVLSVDEFSDDFYLEWVFKGNVIDDSDRIKNSKTNKLTFSRLDEDDAGNYSVYVVNKNTQNKILMGIVKVAVELPPDIARDFPDTLSNNGNSMSKISLVALSKGDGLYYILYIDGEAQSSEQFRAQDMYGNTDYGFIFGGNDSNLKPGVYQYRFRNDCGLTWSNRMTVINENYKE